MLLWGLMHPIVHYESLVIESLITPQREALSIVGVMISMVLGQTPREEQGLIQNFVANREREERVKQVEQV